MPNVMGFIVRFRTRCFVRQLADSERPTGNISAFSRAPRDSARLPGSSIVDAREIIARRRSAASCCAGVCRERGSSAAGDDERGIEARDRGRCDSRNDEFDGSFGSNLVGPAFDAGLLGGPGDLEGHGLKRIGDADNGDPRNGMAESTLTISKVERRWRRGLDDVVGAGHHVDIPIGCQ